MRKDIKIKIADVCIFISSYPVLYEQLRRKYADFLSPTEEVELKIDIYPRRMLNSAHSSDYQTIKLPLTNNYSLISNQSDEYALWFHGYWGKIDLEFKSAVLFADDPSITVVELFIGFCLSLYLSLRNGVIIHGCGIADDKRGYLFVGESESGKSTVANLAEHRTVLSDEAIIIRKQSGMSSEEQFKMYGAPWVEGMFSNDTAVLDSIFFLKKDSQMKFEPLTAAQSTVKMLSNRFYSNKYMMDKILDLCATICSKMLCYEMHFVPDKALIWRDINGLQSMSS